MASTSTGGSVGWCLQMIANLAGPVRSIYKLKNIIFKIKTFICARLKFPPIKGSIFRFHTLCRRRKIFHVCLLNKLFLARRGGAAMYDFLEGNIIG